MTCTYAARRRDVSEANPDPVTDQHPDPSPERGESRHRATVQRRRAGTSSGLGEHLPGRPYGVEQHRGQMLGLVEPESQWKPCCSRVSLPAGHTLSDGGSASPSGPAPGGMKSTAGRQGWTALWRRCTGVSVPHPPADDGGEGQGGGGSNGATKAQRPGARGPAPEARRPRPGAFVSFVLLVLLLML